MLPKPVRSRLFRLPGLADVGVRDRRLLAKSSTPMTYHPTSVIVDPDVPDHRLRIVLDGRVRLHRGDEPIGEVGSGTLLGLQSPDPTSHLRAVALTPVRSVVVPSPVLQVVAQRNGSVAYWLQRDSDLVGRIEFSREA